MCLVSWDTIYNTFIYMCLSQQPYEVGAYKFPFDRWNGWGTGRSNSPELHSKDVSAEAEANPRPCGFRVHALNHLQPPLLVHPVGGQCSQSGYALSRIPSPLFCMVIFHSLDWKSACWELVAQLSYLLSTTIHVSDDHTHPKALGIGWMRDSSFFLCLTWCFRDSFAAKKKYVLEESLSKLNLSLPHSWKIIFMHSLLPNGAVV